MRVLLGGGSGFIGRHVQSLLRQKGHDVTLISRTRGPDRITWGDLKRKGLPENCGAVINLAGENLMNPIRRWNDAFKSDLTSSRIDLTRHVVEAIVSAKQRPKVWVSTSGVGYYPNSRTNIYTEEDEGGRGDFLSQLSFKWEKAAQLPPSVNDVRHVTIRVGLALGRDGGSLKNLYVPFSLGLGGRLGSGNQWFPWIHVDDVAGIFVHAVENEKVTGVLNAVAPNCVTNAEFTSTFAKSLCRPAMFPVPGFMLSLLYGSERASIILEGQHVLPKRTLDSGYRFLYPDLKSACKDFTRKK